MTRGRRRFWRSIRLVALAGLALSVVGFMWPASESSGPVTYELAFDRGDVEPDQEGWTVLNDLGWEVTVTGGDLSTFEVTLIDCPHDHSWVDSVLGVFGAQAAFAGHGDDDETSTVHGPVTMSVIDDEPVVFGSAELTEPAYCELHVAWAGGDATADMTTLSLAGEATPADDAEPIAFSVDTTTAWGTITALSDDEFHLEPGPDTTVEVVIDLGSLFDGVDFSDLSGDDLGTALLRNIADSTSIAVVEGDLHT